MASMMFTKTSLLAAAAVSAFAVSASADTVILNFVVTNTSGNTQDFFIESGPVAMSTPGGSLISGSITGTVTDLNGNTATVSAVNGKSIYTAVIDGVAVRDLMDAPGYFFSAGQFLSNAAIPEGFANEASMQVTTDIRIRLEFSLTAGDSASFTSIFTVIPAPGAFVALAGVFGLVRRRRA